jgi:hypothetical protein
MRPSSSCWRRWTGIQGSSSWRQDVWWVIVNLSVDVLAAVNARHSVKRNPAELPGKDTNKHIQFHACLSVCFTEGIMLTQYE